LSQIYLINALFEVLFNGVKRAISQIEVLSLTQLEALGEALLDFSEASDLLAWLQARQIS
jgi:hypothetical protein